MNPVLLPILIPFLAGIALLFGGSRPLQVAVSLIAGVLGLSAAVHLLTLTSGGQVLTAQMGGYAAPYGISMVADHLSALLVVLTAISALVVSLHVAIHPDPLRERYRLMGLLQMLFTGVQLSFLTGDLFNLFVAFEVMLVASYGLAVLGSTREQLREGFRYVVMNLLVSALFVGTAGIVYGLMGTLNMAHIGQRSLELGGHPSVAAVSLLLLLVFAGKAALFPLGFWLPGTYPALPPAVGAFFAAMLTKIGIYALYRVGTVMFVADAWSGQQVLLILGIASMLFGAFGALSQREWRRILAFLVVSSVGYMAYGLGLGTPEALAATTFYMMVSVIVTLAAFLVAAIAEHMSGQSHVRARGFVEISPALALMFMLCALTLAGLPPTAGFIGKFALVQAGLAQGGTLALLGVGVILLASLLTLQALLGIWLSFFWGRRPRGSRARPLGAWQGVPTVMAVTLVAALFVLAGPLYAYAQTTAAQLSDPQVYIRGVLEVSP